MTLIVCVVSPDDHRLPVASEEVNVTEPPSQNVVGPLAVTTGVAGGVGSDNEPAIVFDVHPLLNVIS